MTRLLYVYAVVAGEAADRLASVDLRGIDAAPVRGVAIGADDAVLALVSDVDAGEFDQEALDRNVADAQWLAERAAAHQRVNAAARDHLPATLPLAFGTIFRDETGLRRALGERAADLSTALARVADRAEWVCTLTRDVRRAGAFARSRAADAGPAPAASPGRAYLDRRRAAVEEASRLRDLDREAVAELRELLAAAAEDVTDEPVIEVEGGGPIARWTALVHGDRVSDLERTLAAAGTRWGPRGYTAGLSGPWPAYRAAARLGTIGERA